MVYVLFVLAIGLAAVVGLQFAYLAFLEAANRQLKSEIQHQEQMFAALQRSLSLVPPTSSSRALAHATATTTTPTITPSAQESWPEYLETER